MIGAVELAVLERIQRKVLWLSTWMVHHANVIRPNADGTKVGESVVYDGDGQLLTATLMDYALPRADSVPALEIGHLETPSPLTPGGVKGMGEGGTIGAPAAIANAVADAARGLGVRIGRLPISCQEIALA